MATLVGIFVGGRGRRLGGVAKGLLPAPDQRETLLTRLLRVANDAAPHAEFVLVGANEAYASLEASSAGRQRSVLKLSDVPAGIGPIGGLHALLLHAAERGYTSALALAVDLPLVGTPLIQRLLHELPNADALAPQLDGKWHPLFTRYAPARCLPLLTQLIHRASKPLAARALLDALDDAARLILSPAEELELCDWDTPDDVTRTLQGR